MESPDIPSPRYKQMVEEKRIVLWRTKSQGSVERANQDVENIVAVWKRDNNRSDWAAALPIIQYTKNARHHTGIGRSPFRAMFGKEASLGVEHLNLESSMAKHVANEEDLTTMFPDEVIIIVIIIVVLIIMIQDAVDEGQVEEVEQEEQEEQGVSEVIQYHHRAQVDLATMAGDVAAALLVADAIEVPEETLAQAIVTCFACK